MALIQDYLAANPYQPPKPQPKKKQTGKGGLLTSLISEGSAVAGAAASAPLAAGLAPLTGGLSLFAVPAIAAGLSAFGGRIAENKVRDNRYGVGDAAKEGAVTGLFGAAGKGVKAAGSLTKFAAKGGGTLEDALVSAGNAANKNAASTITSKLQTSAADRSAKGFGIKTTDKFLPEQADEVSNFINTRASNYAKVTPGAPLNQARDLQKVKNGVVSQLDAALNSINRPIKPTEAKQLISNLDTRLVNDPDVTGKTELANKFKTLVNGRDIKGLEKLRRQYDDIAFKANGDPSTTAKAAEALAIRDTIDEFVTPLSKEYKAIKGDYSLSNKALQLASKEAGVKPNGITPPFMGGGLSKGVGGNMIATGRNKLNGALAGNGMGIAASPARSGMVTAGKGQLVDALLGTSGSDYGSMNADTTTTTNDIPSTQSNTDISGQYQNEGDLSSTDQQPEETSPYSRDALMYDIQRDPKNAAKYIDTYKSLQDIYAPPAASKLNSTQLQQANNANSGLQSLQTIAQTLQQNPNAAKLSSLPGGSLTANLTHTGSYKAAINNATDVIGRLRSGGAINADEEKRFLSLLPSSFDDQSTVAYKLQSLSSLFQSFANPQAAQPDLATAVMQSGGYQ